MGSSFDGTIGYGVEIPEGFEPNNSPVGWDEFCDWYEYLEEVCQKFDVQYDVSGYHGEFLGAALFVGETTSIDGVGVFNANRVSGSPTVEELERLREASEYVGVPYKPEFIAVTSYELRVNVQELIDLLSDMNPEHRVTYGTQYGLELVSWIDVEHSDEFGDTVVLGS